MHADLKKTETGRMPCLAYAKRATIAGRPLGFKLNCKLSLHQGGGGLVLEGGFGDVHDFGEGGGVSGGDVGQRFAVKDAFRGFEAFHEAAVGQAGFANGGVDADLPKVTEGAFFNAAIAIGVLSAMVNGVGSVTVKFGAAHPEAFGGPDHSCAALAGGGSIGNAHVSSK